MPSPKPDSARGSCPVPSERWSRPRQARNFSRASSLILAALEDAESSVRESGDLQGALRVAMPSTMGIQVVIPRLAPFAERHPRLHIELMLDDW
ncbi:MAG: hypothetical protein J0J06_07365 [Sphingomonas sp.]|nr:hypothetical protein [Sphingomonas sp.]